MLDDHPLRYSELEQVIEKILLRRSHAHRLEGYTLETALEIADAVVPLDLTSAKSLTRR